MYLKEPKDENGKLSVAVELTTTIYSGHAPGEERRTATARLVPLEQSEGGELIPIADAASEIALTINETTPPYLIPHIQMVQEGIKGIVRAFGHDVT